MRIILRTNQFVTIAWNNEMELVPSLIESKPLSLEGWQEGTGKAYLYNILYQEGKEKSYLCHPGDKKREANAALQVVPQFSNSDEPDVFKINKAEQEMYFELRLCRDAIQIFQEYLSSAREELLPILKNAIEALSNFCTNKNPGTIILNMKYGSNIPHRQRVNFNDIKLRSFWQT